MKLWVEWVLIVPSFQKRLNEMVGQISRRSKVMLKRAVRMKKSLRHLPLARLVMAANDFDLIAADTSSTLPFLWLQNAFYWTEFIGLSMVALLPSQVADVYIESV
eukprot:gene42180-52382_t